MNEKTDKQIILDFSKKFKTRRFQIGLTQEELASLAEMHVNFIGRIERGSANPSLTSLVKLSIALRTSIQNLI